MRDLLQTLIKAKSKKIYKNNEFKDILYKLKSLNINNKIDWDDGACEEWAFVRGTDLSMMLNCKIGICFAKGVLDDIYLDALNQVNCVCVDGYDLKEWYISLADLQKYVPEITWHASKGAVDANSFSLYDLFFATV